jgi:hypothetical protein
VESIDIASERLKRYRYLHKFFYKEYVESEDELGKRDYNSLILSLRAKAMYYRLKTKIVEPTNVIFYN